MTDLRAVADGLHQRQILVHLVAPATACCLHEHTQNNTTNSPAHQHYVAPTHPHPNGALHHKTPGQRTNHLHQTPPTRQTRVEEFHAWANEVDVPELDRLSRTLRTWEQETLNYHRTGATNGPTEAVNLIIEKTRRLGHGFRNWDNYRLRLLLHCGVTWYTPPTKRIRGHKPPIAA